MAGTKQESQINNCVLFAEYAGDDLAIWKMIVGQKVKHTSLGEGVVARVDSSEHSGDPRIWVRFDQDPSGELKRRFTPASFGNSDFFSYLALPDALDGIQGLRERLERQTHADEHQKQASESESKRDSADIRRICRERNIATLIHFTRVANLRSILKTGLLGRSTLEDWPIEEQPVYNDDQRLDRHKEAICLSISFPNYQMFYKYRQANRAEWVILFLAASVLWKLDCAFFEDNAASKRVWGTSLSERRQAFVLARMFDDCDRVRRRDLNIPDSYPTNPQAEVLVFERISPFYIQAVHFYSQGTYKRWVGDNVNSDAMTLCVNRRYFQPRRDYLTWQTSERHDATVFSDEEIPF
jgi:hypothetical protein